MKYNRNTSLAIALLGFAAAIPAGAVTVAAGDLIFGMRSTNSSLQGNGFVYVADLGQLANYTTSNSVGSAATTGQDLSDIFGTNWSARTDLQWAVVGGTSGNNLFVTKAQVDSVTIPTPLQVNTQSGRNLVYSDITNILGIGIVGGLDDSPATTNTAYAAQQTTSYANNWRDNFGPGGKAGSAGSTGTLDLNAFVNPGVEGTPSQTLALFNITGGNLVPTTYVGSFSLGADGVISFATAAVPEPSSALLLCGSLIPLFTRRRRNA